MMWLMHRPAPRNDTAATEPNRSNSRFSNRELAQLPELLQARRSEPDQPLPVTNVTRVKERAA